MYVLNNYTPSNFGEFGYWQFVIGILQHIGYGVAAGTKYSATGKYLKKQEHTQQLTHAEQTALKQKELAIKKRLLDVEGKTELYEDLQIKKLVIIIFVTLISVTVLGLGFYYYFSAGGGND